MNNDRPAEELKEEIRTYLELKADEIRLSFASYLARLLNRLLFLFLIIALAVLLTGFLAAAFGAWIGELLGSAVWGHLAVAGFVLLTIGVLFLFRERLFTDGLVRLILSIFYDE